MSLTKTNDACLCSGELQKKPLHYGKAFLFEGDYFP
jgi:hypothetical protein